MVASSASTKPRRSLTSARSTGAAKPEFSKPLLMTHLPTTGVASNVMISNAGTGLWFGPIKAKRFRNRGVFVAFMINEGLI
jgi:hypothetical protein